MCVPQNCLSVFNLSFHLYSQLTMDVGHPNMYCVFLLENYFMSATSSQTY